MADAPPPPAPCWSSIVQKQAPPPRAPQPPTADRFVGACKSKEGIAVAVVDANAIIQGGDQLVNLADKIVSVADVLLEVRDPASRLRLGAVPFEVETMEPDPDALKKVISFARATGDLQTLSDVDLKLIALTYTLEAQLHGTKHLRDSPPPLHVVNVKRLPEKDMPGWGSNVPNLAEWEALEHVTEAASYSDSRILPLKDLNMNKIPVDNLIRSENGSIENGNDADVDHQENGENLVKNRRILPRKKYNNIEGKQNVAEEIMTSQGDGDNDGDWHPAVSRSTHRRYLRRKARRELSAASETSDHLDDADMDEHHIDDTLSQSKLADTQLANADIEKEEARVGNTRSEVSIELRSDSSEILAQKEGLDMTSLPIRHDDSHMVRACETHEIEADECDAVESLNTDLDNLDIMSEEDFSVDQSAVDDGSSEQSWTIRPLSDSSVACVTGDFAMQNVILQIGLRLLAPGGMQIRQLHRWILKCHACNKVTAEIGRVFCPKCGNGGTLRKVSVTVGENGIILAARRPRISLRGTKFSLPLPQGGRDAITKNLILREDQLPHKVLYPKSKKKSNKQDVDFFSSDDVFSHSADKRTPFQPPLRKALAVFSGRRNPNDNHFSRSKH